MKITREDVLHIAQLARVGVTDEDVEKMSKQLSNIIENFEILQQIDTTDIPPTAQPIPLENVIKEDQVKPSLSVEDTLANAPLRNQDFFQVKAVLE